MDKGIYNSDYSEWKRITSFLAKNCGKWVIYMLINKVNGKIYIGKTFRFSDRMYSYRNNRKYKPYPIIFAIRKYGIGNFDVKIIEDFENFTDKKLKEREVFWINYYESFKKEIGYNAIKINTYPEDHYVSDQTRKKMSIAAKKPRDRSYQRKPVNQINIKTGEIIKTWDCARSAAEFILGNRNFNKIYDVCNQRVDAKGKLAKTSLGFGWEYTDNPIQNKDYSPPVRRPVEQKTREKMLLSSKGKRKRKLEKPVLQINAETNEIMKIWDSARFAALDITGKLGSAKSIQNCCRTNKGLAFGFIWRYN